MFTRQTPEEPPVQLHKEEPKISLIKGAAPLEEPDIKQRRLNAAKDASHFCGRRISVFRKTAKSGQALYERQAMPKTWRW